MVEMPGHRDRLAAAFPLPKYERPEGAFAPPVAFEPTPRHTAADAGGVVRDSTSLPWQYHDATERSGHERLIRCLTKQVGDLEQQNAELQASNNKLLERARVAEARANRLEAAHSDGAYGGSSGSLYHG